MFKTAQTLNKYAIKLIWSAIVLFMMLGTLSSLKALHQNATIAWLFHYLPLILVGLTIPLTLMTAFLLHRLNLVVNKTLALMLAVASLLFLTGTYYGMAGWLGLVFVLKWRIAGFVKFLEENQNNPNNNPQIN